MLCFLCFCPFPICVFIHIRTKGEVDTVKHVRNPPVIFLLTVPSQCFYCGFFLLFMFHVCLCFAILSIPCSLVITCWEESDLLAVLCVMFSYGFLTFLYGVLGLV